MKRFTWNKKCSGLSCEYTDRAHSLRVFEPSLPPNESSICSDENEREQKREGEKEESFFTLHWDTKGHSREASAKHLSLSLSFSRCVLVHVFIGQLILHSRTR